MIHRLKKSFSHSSEGDEDAVSNSSNAFCEEEKEIRDRGRNSHRGKYDTVNIEIRNCMVKTNEEHGSSKSLNYNIQRIHIYIPVYGTHTTLTEHRTSGSRQTLPRRVLFTQRFWSIYLLR